MNEHKGKEIVQNMIESWSKVYEKQVFFLNQVGNVFW